MVWRCSASKFRSECYLRPRIVLVIALPDRFDPPPIRQQPAEQIAIALAHPGSGLHLAGAFDPLGFPNVPLLFGPARSPVLLGLASRSEQVFAGCQHRPRWDLMPLGLLLLC